MGLQDLQDRFLEACKVGDLPGVQAALALGADVNCSGGWGLRRAVRYNHCTVWQALLAHREIQPNLQNQYGLSALHTAARFNIPGAVYDLLRHPTIKVNEKTQLGSSPVMVAAKYCRKEALAGLITDRRVDLNSTDASGRMVDQVVAVAVAAPHAEDKADIMEWVARERMGRLEEEGRRDSMDEESIDVDGMHKLRVYSQVKELLGELRGLHQMDRLKLVQEQEVESRQFVTKLESDYVAFLERQRLEQNLWFSQVIGEKKEFDLRQQESLNSLLKRQEQETMSLQGGASPSKPHSGADSPKSAPSRPNSRRPSLKTHAELPSCESLSDSSGPSLWEWTVPDEGYCTGSAAPGEVPVMVDSARKELECPICMEVMMPPARIWQCKVGHVICEQCMERVRRQQLAAVALCPSCKTAPFIGRNLALERISRSLFQVSAGTK